MHKGKLNDPKNKSALSGKSYHFGTKSKNERFPIVHGEPWNLQGICSMVRWANRGGFRGENILFSSQLLLSAAFSFQIIFLSKLHSKINIEMTCIFF